MTIRIAINGFGRIGRLVLRALVESRRDDMQIVAINDLADAKTLAHLLKFDSVHGRFPGAVSVEQGAILIDDNRISVTAERDPAALPWAKQRIDIVMECTGFFRTADQAQKHIEAGAKRVLISAPAKDDSKTIVFGINHDQIDAADKILSNASCTTNALAPILSVLHEAFGVESGMLTTVHAYTGNQPSHDGVHKDPYRGRAAALSMVPTTTGAAEAIGNVMPELAGKISGFALRVPVPNVSAIDLTLLTDNSVTVASVRKAFKTTSQTRLKGVLSYVEEKIVSSDFNHDPHSAGFIADQVYVNPDNDRLLRVLAWYDNEWGFSNRMLDTASEMAKFL